MAGGALVRARGENRSGEGDAGVLRRPYFDGRGAGHAAAASRGSVTRGSHGRA
jgi:hypothetical protein